MNDPREIIARAIETPELQCLPNLPAGHACVRIYAAANAVLAALEAEGIVLVDADEHNATLQLVGLHGGEVLHGEFVLRGGATSPAYIDWKKCVPLSAQEEENT